MTTRLRTSDGATHSTSFVRRLLNEGFDVACSLVVSDEFRRSPLKFPKEELVALLGQFVLVRALVNRAFGDESALDEFVEVGV